VIDKPIIFFHQPTVRLGLFARQPTLEISKILDKYSQADRLATSLNNGSKK
jgi:hypothetical protein